MKKMKRMFWLLPVFLVTLMTGCLKDDVSQGTIVLMGTESNVKPIAEVIPDTLLTFVADSSAMDSLVLTLPTGNMPPDIQGGYLFGPRDLYKYNGVHPMANDTVFLRFGGEPDTTGGMAYYHGQNNIVVPCDIYGDILEKGNVFSIKSAPGFVVGVGDRFTAYFVVEYHCEEPLSGTEYTLKRGYVFTGTVAPEGIRRAVLACVNIEVKPITSSSTVPPEIVESLEKGIFIYRVKVSGNPHAFGTAQRILW